MMRKKLACDKHETARRVTELLTTKTWKVNGMVLKNLLQLLDDYAWTCTHEPRFVELRKMFDFNPKRTRYIAVEVFCGLVKSYSDDSPRKWTFFSDHHEIFSVISETYPTENISRETNARAFYSLARKLGLFD